MAGHVLPHPGDGPDSQSWLWPRPPEPRRSQPTSDASAEWCVGSGLWRPRTVDGWWKRGREGGREGRRKHPAIFGKRAGKHPAIFDVPVLSLPSSASGPEPLLLVVLLPRHARVSWRRWSSTCRSHCYQSPAPPTFRRRAFRCVLAPFELPAQSEEQIRHYQYSPCSIARNACRHCVPQPTKNRIHLVRAGRLHSILLRPLTSTLWTMKYLSQWHERSTTFTYTRRAPPGTTALPTQASACVVWQRS